MPGRYTLQMRFGNVDPRAKAQIDTISTDDKKPWSTLENFRIDGVEEPDLFATSEFNYTILDGKAQEFPDDPMGLPFGWMSDSISNSEGVFENPPTLLVSFNEPRKSVGISFHQYSHYPNDYASSVKITWYSEPDWTGPLDQGEYVLEDTQGVVSNGVEGYQSVKFEFTKTLYPYRYLKIYMIEWGMIQTILDEEINTLRVLEEIDPTSRSISVNSMNAQVRTLNSLFSPITSPNFNGMMENQYVTIFRNNTPFGTFFLDRWEDKTQDGIVFDLIGYDALYVMDQYKYYGGIYDNVPVIQILEALFNLCFPSRLITYNLDDAYANKTVSGFIPITTCATALQHIAFALNATVDTARTNQVWIYPREVDIIKYKIPLEEQYRGGLDLPAQYVTKVEVTSHNYSRLNEDRQIFQGTLPIGTQTVEFRDPMWGVTVSAGAEIVNVGDNYVTLNVATFDEITITGKSYLDSTFIHSVGVPSTVGKIDITESYKDYTLVNRDFGTELAAKLLAFFGNQVQVKGDFVLNDKEVGYVAQIETRNRTVLGVLAVLDSDLRANKTQVETVGMVVDVGITWYYVEQQAVTWDFVEGRELSWIGLENMIEG